MLGRAATPEVGFLTTLFGFTILGKRWLHLGDLLSFYSFFASTTEPASLVSARHVLYILFHSAEPAPRGIRRRRLHLAADAKRHNNGKSAFCTLLLCCCCLNFACPCYSASPVTAGIATPGCLFLWLAQTRLAPPANHTSGGKGEPGRADGGAIDGERLRRDGWRRGVPAPAFKIGACGVEKGERSRIHAAPVRTTPTPTRHRAGRGPCWKLLGRIEVAQPLRQQALDAALRQLRHQAHDAQLHEREHEVPVHVRVAQHIEQLLGLVDAAVAPSRARGASGVRLDGGRGLTCCRR